LWNRVSSYFAKCDEHDNVPEEDLARQPETCLGCHKDIQHFIDGKQCVNLAMLKFFPEYMHSLQQGKFLIYIIMINIKCVGVATRYH
jgi:hypothetical protein